MVAMTDPRYHPTSQKEKEMAETSNEDDFQEIQILSSMNPLNRRRRPLGEAKHVFERSLV